MWNVAQGAAEPGLGFSGRDATRGVRSVNRKNADPATRGFRRNSLSNMIAPGQRFLDPGAGCKDKAQKKPRYARALALLRRNNSHAHIGDELERTVQRRVRLRSYEMCMAHSRTGELSSLRPGHSRTSQTRLRGFGEAGTGGFLDRRCISSGYMYLLDVHL